MISCIMYLTTNLPILYLISTSQFIMALALFTNHLHANELQLLPKACHLMDAVTSASSQ
jgi:hypothetical protein